MNNYEFCARWAIDRLSSAQNNFRVLDYGCGAGQIVKLLREQQIEAYGCDVFYDGGNYYSVVEASLLERSTVIKMDGDTIPFESNYFDVVINNQVMEHVENLDRVLQEIDRVLTPGGMVLSLFPHLEIWREVHCQIPFIHWFPKHSRARYYYALALRSIGLGSFKSDKPIERWSKDTCEWLAQWTFYRSKREIDGCYSKYFANVRHIEDYWLQSRTQNRPILIKWMPAFMRSLIGEKLGGVAIVAQKHGQSE